MLSRKVVANGLYTVTRLLREIAMNAAGVADPAKAAASQTAQGFDIESHLFAILGPAVAVVAGIVIALLLVRVFRIWREKKTFSVRGIPPELELLRGPVLALIPAVFVGVVIRFISLPDGLIGLIKHILSLWIIGALAWLIVKLLHIVRRLIMSHYEVDVRDNLRARQIQTQLQVLERIAIFIVVVIAAAVMLMTFDQVRQVGVSILASAGVIGIVVGFAAQRSLGNLIAGIQIAITQPVRLDDVVVVEGEWGRIEEITLTYVVVRIWDQRRLVVPITYFIEKPFVNWTRTTAELLGTVYLYADYTIPVERVREELHRILEVSDLWDKRVWGLLVTNTTERAVELRAVMSTQDSSSAWNLRCHVREKLLEFLQKNFPDSLPRVRLEMDRTRSASDSSGERDPA
ncbi:MAG: mechanosensitive ion channel domain-containing protein [Candidatus Eisenbacteria bacterium]